MHAMIFTDPFKAYGSTDHWARIRAPYSDHLHNHCYVPPGSRLSEVPSASQVEQLNLSGFNAERTHADGLLTSVREKPTDMVTPTTDSPQEGPFILSEALPVVPPGIVKRILKGAFVDMAELLKDNLEMERRRSLVENGAMPPFQARHSRREIPDVLSWLHCFTLYAAVVCSKYPNKVKGLLAYQAFIISEARRGGRGWLMYDGAFRQQIQSLEATDFARVNQSLYSTTCLAFGNRGRVCPTCLMADQDPEDCALHPSKLGCVRRRADQGRNDPLTGE